MWLTCLSRQEYITVQSSDSTRPAFHNLLPCLGRMRPDTGTDYNRAPEPTTFHLGWVGALGIGCQKFSNLLEAAEQKKRQRVAGIPSLGAFDQAIFTLPGSPKLIFFSVHLDHHTAGAMSSVARSEALNHGNGHASKQIFTWQQGQTSDNSIVIAIG